MFKGHPKGLYVAFLANMGERFGFYTMMAILVLFLQARYALPADRAGDIYSWFYFGIYILALVGGLIADWTHRYKGVILAGIVVMLAGYVLMAIPGMPLAFAVSALMIIALGNGLFKGNLQALVGQLYDDPKYSHLRDRAFSVFYMGINIGALFAPSAASGIRNWYLRLQGFGYNSDLPYLANQLVQDKPVDTAKLQTLADQVSSQPVTDLAAFAQRYVDVFSTGYNLAFAIAAGAMVVSMLIFVFFIRYLPGGSAAKAKAGDAEPVKKEVPRLPKQEEKQRLIALGLVFLVVMFFWMAFHQNGLTLTLFAEKYTASQVGPGMNLVFNIGSLLCLAALIYGLILVVKKGASRSKITGAVLAAAGGVGAWLFYDSFPATNSVSPEIYQQFNPLFIVLLTPLVVGFFAWLDGRGKEPSSPRKIGIGMLITAVAFTLMAVFSIGLPSQVALHGAAAPAADRVSPDLLIGTYFILTIAELFLSPMGISFVSKVAPPRLQGLMQGCWLGATALGNKLLVVGSWMWVRFEIWQVWTVFVVLCLIAALVIFSLMKRLERVTKGA